MTAPFTPEQSAEIDRRIVEMMSAVMGEGQYSRACQAIADERAAAFAAADTHGSSPTQSSQFNHPASAEDIKLRLECLRLALAVPDVNGNVVATARQFENFARGVAGDGE